MKKTNRYCFANYTVNYNKNDYTRIIVLSNIVIKHD